MIKHRVFIGLILLLTAMLGSLLLWGRARVAIRTKTELVPMRTLVGKLQLTDLSLWTEARYTRHPSQADWFTPFQDFPSALEHFPAGSIIAPTRPIDPRP